MTPRTATRLVGYTLTAWFGALVAVSTWTTSMERGWRICDALAGSSLFTLIVVGMIALGTEATARGMRGRR